MTQPLRVRHIYVEQSPGTITQALNGENSWLDFLVGIPAISIIAVDVKAKWIFDDTNIFDVYEHPTLLNFETMSV